MKLQLDTISKVIRLEEKVNLNELYNVLNKLLPQGEWKEFSIETNTTIIWRDPIVYPYYIPTYPIQKLPWITYGTAGSPDIQDVQTSYNVNSGVYNIECSK